MKTSDFYYDLPHELIAQTPSERRDCSRLLVYDRTTGTITHKIFRDVLEYLHPGDALVLNETRVIPARLIGKKSDTGGKLELLLLKHRDDGTYEAIAGPAKRAKIGTEFIFGEGKLKARIEGAGEEGIRYVRFFYEGIFEEVLDQVGLVPLPPYITATLEEKQRYQTVYARINGSAAAPTAGLHFTPELLEEAAAMGVKICKIVLHVGLGTFRPVKVEDVLEHHMHSEYYCVTDETAAELNAVRQAGGRIVCVGTTSARTLETVTDVEGIVHASQGETNIFIYPGYRFKAVDCLITNFHLPESTLIMMISALMGSQETMSVYREAVEQRYRFFSFGDAMLIL